MIQNVLKPANTIIDTIPKRVRFITLRLRKWFLISSIIGVLTGLLVAVLDYIVVDLLLGGAFVGLLAQPLGALLLPIAGLTFTGIILMIIKKGRLNGTEEVIKTFHDPAGRLDERKAPLKSLAAIFTVGFGGSAGLEGPSMYIGAVVGTLVKRVANLLKLDTDDVKSVMIAGASAGMAAIFKAPLTGIVFGLEVPYKDDMAKESLIPSLVASVTSYITFVSIMGIEPLFKTGRIFTLDYRDLLLVAVLGLVIGLMARFFVISYRKSEDFFSGLNIPLIYKLMIGGTIVGITGVISILVLDSPMSLGVGYGVIDDIIAETFTLKILIGLLILKFVAVIATMSTGGVGGIFIPMIMIGATIGAIIGKLSPFEKGHLYPVVGMSSFLAAGYKTPLAAVTFVAETTGSPGYIIPGLIAAAVGFMVSGRLSISRFQRWSRMTKIETMLMAKVKEAMTREVVTVPGDISVDDFFQDYLLKYRFKSFPVVRGDHLAGMIALSDVNEIPEEQWDEKKVIEAAVSEVVVAYPEQSLADVLDEMNEKSIDRLPVVSHRDEREIIGIISSSDIVEMEELSRYVAGRRDKVTTT